MKIKNVQGGMQGAMIIPIIPLHRTIAKMTLGQDKMKIPVKEDGMAIVAGEDAMAIVAGEDSMVIVAGEDGMAIVAGEDGMAIVAGEVIMMILLHQYMPTIALHQKIFHGRLTSMLTKAWTPETTDLAREKLREEKRPTQWQGKIKEALCLLGRLVTLGMRQVA